MTWTLSDGQVPDIEIVLSHCLGPPSHRNGSISYLCPFHNDSNPSLVIWQESTRFKCFTCGAEGDAIDFLRRFHDGIGFREATRMLEELFAEDDVGGPKPVDQGSKIKEQPNPDAMEKIVQDAISNLWAPPGAQALVELRARGLVDRTIFEAQLGYFEETQDRVISGKYTPIPAGIVIPWRDPRGRVVMLKIRRPAGSEPKYLSVGQLPIGALYAAGPFQRGGPLIIVEGELDTLLLVQELGREVMVVTLGSADADPDEVVLRRLLGCGAVFAATDADEAGDRAAAKWTTAFPRCRRVVPPSGKDWTEAAGRGVDLRAFWSALLGVGPTPAPAPSPAPTPVPTPEVMTTSEEEGPDPAEPEPASWWLSRVRDWPEWKRREWWYLACQLKEEGAFPEADVAYRAFARLRRQQNERLAAFWPKLQEKELKRQRAKYPGRPDDPGPFSGPFRPLMDRVRVIVGPGELDAPSAAEAVRRAFDADPDREEGTVVLEGPGIVHTDPLGRRTLVWMPPREFAAWAVAHAAGDRSPAFFDSTLMPTGPPRGPLMTEEELINRLGLVPLERGDDPPDGPIPGATAVNVLVEERRIVEVPGRGVSRRRGADRPDLQEGSETNATERRTNHFGDGDHAVPEVVLDVGGKHYLAERIIDLFPRHLHYCEPFAGGLAVLLARDPDDERFWVPPVPKVSTKGVSEVVNDINGRLTNFWRVLQDPDRFERFRRIVETIPMSRAEWDKAHAHRYGSDPVADAVAFFVDCRQSRAGEMKGFTPITRTRTRHRMNGNVSEWIDVIECFTDVHAMLRRVLVESMDAIALIEREDTPNTLFYIDPPYVPETRASPDAYDHEMTVDDHRRLLAVLRECKGKVILSGYPSELYDDRLAGWDRREVSLPNNAAGGVEKRRMIEVLWANFKMSP
jgi:DNA adenine methylase